MVFVTQQSH